MVLARKEFDATSDVDGSLLTNVEARVELEGGGLVSIYSDRAGATPLANPATFVDGHVAFHVEGGAYKITLTKGAYTRVLRYQGIGLLQEADADPTGLPLDGSEPMTGPITFNHQASPANPAAGLLSLFAKSDDRLYTRNSAGAEVALTSGPTVSVDNTLARFNGTTGAIQGSGIVVDDSDRLSISVGTADADLTARTATGQLAVGATNGYNAIVGAVVQLSGATDTYATGVTGSGYNKDAGNQAFGVFGEARAYAAGVVTNEFNTFNYSAAPPTSFFPSRAFGIAETVPVTLTVAAAGDYQSHTAIQIGREGSVPNSYLHGLTFYKDAVTEYAIIIDADATTSAKNGIYIKNKGNTGIPLRIDTTATLDAAQTVIGVNNASVSDVFVVKQDGSLTTKGRIRAIVADTAIGFLVSGVTNGIRFSPRAGSAVVEGVDNTGVGSFQTLGIGGSEVIITISGNNAVTVDTSKNLLGEAAIRSKAPTSGIGYATGAGGTVTQATSKSTGVTLSKVSGQITMNGAALAAATIVSFVLTNTAIAATDVLVLNHVSGGTIGAYTLNAQCAAGSATINVRNNTAGSLSDAIVIGFTLIKGVTS